jgi:hypothetical protein
MDTIAIPTKNIVEPILDDRETMYRAKHYLESGIKFTGIWQCDQYRDGQLISGGSPEPNPNTFITEGVAYFLNILFYTTSKSAARIWYVGIYDLNVTPAAANTSAADLGAAGNYGAFQATTEMDEATYPEYTAAAISGARIATNAANKAEFTCAATRTVYGAFLSSVSDPTSTAGYLLAAKKFDASRAVIDGDVLNVGYVVTVS